MIQLRKLIAEQAESGLDAVLQQHLAAFNTLAAQLRQFDYAGVTPEAADILRDNAAAIVDAYTEYIANTRAARRQYASESEEDIVTESVYTMLERIKGAIYY